jgi:hypothetical protein
MSESRCNPSFSEMDTKQTDVKNVISQHLVGRRLSGVTFVMDYVQLQFDPPPSINALTPITVRAGDRAAISGDESFRNLLCEQIPKTIRSVSLSDGEELILTFGDGSTISLSLRKEHYVCPEAINFYGPNHLCIIL